jgi:acyl dehydratase
LNGRERRREFAMSTSTSVSKLTDRIGDELGASPWMVIDQAKMDAHAELTGDGLDDWLHTDPARAAELSPTGTTIVQGSLLISNLVRMAESLGAIDNDAEYLLNYGFDRLRIINPVPAGSRIRGRFTLKDVKPKGDHGYVATFDTVIEIEGEEQPALVAEWLFYARTSRR